MIHMFNDKSYRGFVVITMNKIPAYKSYNIWCGSNVRKSTKQTDKIKIGEDIEKCNHWSIYFYKRIQY